jgi:hypothetical protein
MNNILGNSVREELRQQLIVPLAVADILHHDLDVEQDMQYSLHMALSEIDPDTALLAIAFCASDMAERNMIYAPIASALQKEADKIIEEYGEAWLRYNKHAPMPSEFYAKILMTVPEDLEALADLIDALIADLDCVNEATPVIGNILAIQARAHMEIADYIMSQLHTDQYEKPQYTQATGFAGDNVIVFPGAGSRV